MTSVRVSGSQTARLVRCLVGALLACGCGAGEDRSPRAETGAHAIESLGLLVEAPIGADAIDTDWGVTFAHADARFTVTVLGELDVTTLVEAVADSFLHFRARSVEREEFSGGWLISHEGIPPDVPSEVPTRDLREDFPMRDDDDEPAPVRRRPRGLQEHPGKVGQAGGGPAHAIRRVRSVFTRAW
jgi:hypothetical protein